MPDTWDDDWIQKSESKPSTPNPAPTAAKLSKAERRAKQAEFNRQLWEDADNHQEENYFLKSQGVVPLKSEFKPAVQVLSRKPTAKSANALDGLGQSNIDDDEDDDESNKNVMTAEERKQKAQREREEKQKAYEERRRELFGPENPVFNYAMGKKGGSPRNQSRVSRPSSSASSRTRQLYDPHDSMKPDHVGIQKRETPANDIRPTREPRAPDGSGRGGFGFAHRGGHPT